MFIEFYQWPFGDSTYFQAVHVKRIVANTFVGALKTVVSVQNFVVMNVKRGRGGLESKALHPNDSSSIDLTVVFSMLRGLKSNKRIFYQGALLTLTLTL